MARVNLSLVLLASLVIQCLAAEAKDLHLQTKLLCSQCGACDVNRCPASESYPHMTAWDDTLIAGALQSDYVKANDRGIYSVPDIKGGTSEDYDAYFGWESTSGLAFGYHRFRNYMDKCSKGQSFLTVHNHGKVALRALSSLTSLAQADWKSFNPPKDLNHRGFRFWQSRNTGMCLCLVGRATSELLVWLIASLMAQTRSSSLHSGSITTMHSVAVISTMSDQQDCLRSRTGPFQLGVG